MCRVSFILPCYNVGRFITDTLGSLYAQGMPEDEFEVICVNDCSTDDTHDRIAAFAEDHANLILLDQPRNMYSGAARNRGLDVAKGDYIWFVDADDMIKPDCLKQMLEIVDSEDLDILLFNYDEFKDGTPEIFLERRDLFRDSLVMTGNDFVVKEFRCRIRKLTLLWLRLVRRSFIEENHIRFPDLYISQDCPFAWECILLAPRVKSVKERYYLYRASEGSITANKNTAKKAAVWSFQFPFEVERVKKKVNGRVADGIIREMDRNIQHEVNQFAVRYNQLPMAEKPAYFASMRSTSGWYGAFRHRLFRKNRMAYLSGFLGERVFRTVCVRLSGK